MKEHEIPANTELTDRDKMLVEAARSKHYLDWADIDENAADTEEGKRRLHHIAMQKFHQEEAACGLL